jgi:hypothetical protein
VYCERFEDLLVVYDDRLRFIAIKTREQEYGPWRLRDLCASSGAFRSLIRTFKAVQGIEDGREVVLEARLEGALKRDDLIRELATPARRPPSEETISECARLLDERPALVGAFLECVQIEPRMPARELIRDRNLSLLASVAGSMSADDLSDVYDKTIGLLEAAMASELLSNEWPQAIFEPRDPEDAVARLVNSKRLDRDLLDGALAPLSNNGPPLLIGPLDMNC